MTTKRRLGGYSVLFGKYVVAGIIAYPLELLGLWAITEYLHVWYILSAAIALGLAYFLYFGIDVAMGVIRLPNEFRQPKSGSAVEG